MNKAERELQTPFFLMHTERIVSQIENMKSALSSKWDDWIIGYSVKTNNLPWLIKLMKKQGIFAEVVSSDEYNLAKEIGYESYQIIFNGPAKRKAEFREAVESGAIVNIDAKRELEWLCECKIHSHTKIGLRVNFCIEDYCPGESQCETQDGRFGFSYENGTLKDAIDFLNAHGIELMGLHMHCSSKTRSLNIYDAISKVAVQISEEYQLNLEYIDVCGGFFGGMPGKPSFDDYFNVLKKNLDKSHRTASALVIVEPGMALIGANVDYVTSVIDVKNTKNNTFVVTDGSRIHIDPLMKKKSYSYHIEYGENHHEKLCSQIISGFTCMESDRFFFAEMLELKEGDRICFEKVGAYTMGMMPQFIEFYPETYAIMPDGVERVRAKWSAKKFLDDGVKNE